MAELPPDGEDPLRAHFSGKRQHPRFRRIRPVFAVGPAGRFEGVLLDVSRRGALVAIEDPAFYAADADGLALVEKSFPEGVEISFPREDTVLRGSVVRITPCGQEGRLALGVRLASGLGDVDALLLSVPPSGLEEAGVEAEVLPRRRRPGEGVSLLLFAPPGRLLGPLWVGTVVGIGPRVVEATAGRTPKGIRALASAIVASGSTTATLQTGRRAHWHGEVLPCACRQAEGPSAGVVVRVGTLEPLPPRVLRRFEEAPEPQPATTGP